MQKDEPSTSVTVPEPRGPAAVSAFHPATSVPSNQRNSQSATVPTQTVAWLAREAGVQPHVWTYPKLRRCGGGHQRVEGSFDGVAAENASRVNLLSGTGEPQEDYSG
ncbi:hypothetical protein StoSoilB13_44510 (plasmid) [Arthrobacter sp. StoSoilB13]|nr:hypothetical protein StoSoilB13_44510 [Arthrobacter sp. StoSoilB13]